MTGPRTGPSLFGRVFPASPFLVVAASLALLLLAGCRDTYVWNQTMTVSVDTPQGIVSGSSTIRVNALFGQQIMTGNEVHYDVTGEAVVIEIAPGQYVFATLATPVYRIAELYYRSAPERFSAKTRGDWLPQIPEQDGVVEVPAGHYPLFVAFGDIDDPETVKIVAPDDFGKAFGSGYTLVGVTLQITDAPVTTGTIDDILPWLPALEGGYLHGGSTGGRDPVSRVTGMYFSRDN